MLATSPETNLQENLEDLTSARNFLLSFSADEVHSTMISTMKSSKIMENYSSKIRDLSLEFGEEIPSLKINYLIQTDDPDYLQYMENWDNNLLAAIMAENNCVNCFKKTLEKLDSSSIETILDSVPAGENKIRNALLEKYGDQQPQQQPQQKSKKERKRAKKDRNAIRNFVKSIFQDLFSAK